MKSTSIGSLGLQCRVPTGARLAPPLTETVCAVAVDTEVAVLLMLCALKLPCRPLPRRRRVAEEDDEVDDSEAALGMRAGC